MTRSTVPHFHVAIAGTGFGGLGAAIRLQQEGFDDFVLFERADDVGGVWRDNSYPGCACDVQSHLYSFSFAQNPSWTRFYSPQREIQAYLRECAEKFHVLPRVRFNTEVREAAWDEDRRCWRIETSRGVFTADAFIAGVGALSEPAIPMLPGLETFQGKTMHSARWDHAYDLTGRKVAVVGTGASAIQFVPELQPKVEKLVLFQRTAPWVMPRRDRALSELSKRLFKSMPAAQTLVRGTIYAIRELTVLAFMHPPAMKVLQKFAERYLKKTVSDPVLRKKLTPSYTIGCKRILVSDDYLPAVTQPNVEVITEGIREVRPRSIVSGDGVEHPVDAIIFGTGFLVTDQPIARHVRGRDGRTLRESWNGSPKAHLGTTVAGYPNFFMLQGPNTGLGHTSVLTMIESQIEHVVKALKYLRVKELAAIEPTAEAQAAFVAEVDAKLRNTVWNSGGCASWYLDRTGRNSTIWPGFTFVFKRRIERFKPSEYVAIARRPHAHPSATPGSPRGATAAPREVADA